MYFFEETFKQLLNINYLKKIFSTMDEKNAKRLYTIDLIVKISIQSLGLVGNLLMFAVYFKSSLRKMSISMYFRCMAVLGVCQSVVNLAGWLCPVLFLEESAVFCRLFGFLLFYSKPTLAWLEILAGLDRFLTVVFPFRFKFLKRSRTQVVLSAIVLSYNAACYWKILFQTYQHFTECSIDFHGYLRKLDFINAAAVPFVVMGFLSVVTLVGVLRAHLRVRSASVTSKTPSNYSNNRILVRDIRFGVTMIVLNVSFLLMNLPYRVFFNLNWTQIEYKTRIILTYIFQDLFEMYYSTFFYVQLAVNKLIRHELLGIFSSVLRTMLRIFQFKKKKASSTVAKRNVEMRRF